MHNIVIQHSNFFVARRIVVDPTRGGVCPGNRQDNRTMEIMIIYDFMYDGSRYRLGGYNIIAIIRNGRM